MQESYINFDGSYCFALHSQLTSSRKTLLFLHGLGDSSISYIPFFTAKELNKYNLIVPDLLGCGKSSASNEYSFARQSAAILQQIKSLEEKFKLRLDNIILIPHSMGNILAMMLCASTLKNQIKAVVNIEGSITQFGSFISEKVARVHAEGNFDAWFHAFKEDFIFNNFIHEFPVCRSYYVSINICRPLAFLQNALEMREICLKGKGQYTNIAGQQFAGLQLPKVYCYGDESLCKESINFLAENHLATQVFHTKNHFVMLDCFTEFCSFLTNWINAKI